MIEKLEPFAGELRVGDDVIPTEGVWKGFAGIRIKRINQSISEAIIENQWGNIQTIATDCLHLKGQ